MTADVLTLRLKCIFYFLLKGSSEFLLEGDVLIPKTRNAMKCLNEAYSCLWPKSANGNVEIPFLISQKYGRFYFLKYYINGTGFCILTCLFLSTIVDATERKTILRAMKDFEYKTCIRFIPRAAQRTYLSIEPRYG